MAVACPLVVSKLAQCERMKCNAASGRSGVFCWLLLCSTLSSLAEGKSQQGKEVLMLVLK